MMKVRNILLSLSVVGALSYAQGPSSIDTQIQAIQKAPPAQRVDLMNQFKIQLSNMNAQERSAAIGQMQTKMHRRVQAPHEGGNANMPPPQQHTNEMQMKHNEDMHKMQNMSQQQAGSQFGHGVQSAGGSHDMRNVPPPGSPPPNGGVFGGRP